MSDIEYNACPICLCHISQEHITTECNHAFHTNCIDGWMENNDSCPVCRTILNVEEIIENENQIEYEIIQDQQVNRLQTLWWLLFSMILLGIIGFLIFKLFE